MTNTSEKMQEIKTLRAQIKERLAQIKKEAAFLKDQEAKLKEAAKAEREAIKTRAAEAKAKKAAEKERKAREKAEKARTGRRGYTRQEQPKQEAPKSDKRREEDSLAASVAAELMKDFGLNPNSTVKEIQNIRRAYAKKYHPDIVGGDGKRMQIANQMLDGAEKTAKWKAQRAEAA